MQTTNDLLADSGICGLRQLSDSDPRAIPVPTAEVPNSSGDLSWSAASPKLPFRLTPRRKPLRRHSPFAGSYLHCARGAITKSFILKHLQKHTSANTARIAPVSRLHASADFPQVSSCFLMLPNWEARAVTRIPHDLGGGGACSDDPAKAENAKVRSVQGCRLQGCDSRSRSGSRQAFVST